MDEISQECDVSRSFIRCEALDNCPNFKLRKCSTPISSCKNHSASGLSMKKTFLTEFIGGSNVLLAWTEWMMPYWGPPPTLVDTLDRRYSMTNTWWHVLESRINELLGCFSPRSTPQTLYPYTLQGIPHDCFTNSFYVKKLFRCQSPGK